MLSRLLFTLSLVAVPAFVSADDSSEPVRLRALIVDGQNNHKDWPIISAIMKHDLEQTGLFDVDIARTKYTWRGDGHLPQYDLPGQPTEPVKEPKSDPNFAPTFADYDVVVCNFGWKAAAWPKPTQKAFEAYVRGGGGFVVVHAADNSFPEWRAYNEMIGLGGWGGRTEKDGPFVYYDGEGNLKRDESAGGAGHHGPRHAYPVVVRDTKHPITAGLPREWMHEVDELYDSLRGPAISMQVLATAFADPANKGSGRHEPVAMVIDYGQGRVFHTVLGDDERAFSCIGLKTLLNRGCEWAATGDVTQAIPKDFPTAEDVSTKPFEAGAAVLAD